MSAICSSGIKKLAQVGARRRLLLAEARDGVAAGADFAQLLVEHVRMEIDDERNVGMLARHCVLRLLAWVRS